jgi:hypothetical protein
MIIWRYPSRKPRVADVREGLQKWRVVIPNVLNKQSRTIDKRRFPAWELGEGLTTHHKQPASYEMLHRISDFAGSCEHGNEPADSTKVGEFPEPDASSQHLATLFP